MSNFLFSARPIATQQTIGVLRIIIGLFMVYHGWEVFDAKAIASYTEWVEPLKGSPNAITMLYLGKGAEFVGGVLLTIGLLTRVCCFILAAPMIYIAFIMSNGKVWADAQHPFMFVLFAILFFFAGPGSWALDNKLFKK